MIIKDYIIITLLILCLILGYKVYSQDGELLEITSSYNYAYDAFNDLYEEKKELYDLLIKERNNK